MMLYKLFEWIYHAIFGKKAVDTDETTDKVVNANPTALAAEKRKAASASTDWNATATTETEECKT